MKKVLFAALPVLFLLFGSCSKDEEAPAPTPAPAERTCRPTFIKTAPGMAKQAEYIYENQTRLTRLNLFGSSGSLAAYSQYEYRNDGQIQKISSYSATGTMIGYQVYAYNTDNTLNRVTDHAQQNGSMSRIGFTEFEYAGARIRKKFYFEDADPTLAVSAQQFTYDTKGNVYKVDQYTLLNGSLVISATLNYEFDTKRNYNKDLGLARLYPENISPNNITKVTYKNQSGTVVPSFSNNYTYTYNSDNYPVSVKTQSLDGQTNNDQVLEYTCG